MTHHALALFSACVLVVASSLPPAHAAGKVEVQFVEPEHFSDVGRNAIDRERTLNSLGAYLTSLGARLPDGQTLRLEVLDVDLAGELVPRRDGQEVRVIRDRADWPRMKLRYVLQTDGRTLKSGEADLSDMGYRFGLRGYDVPDTDLPYEERMALEWFDKTFGAH